MKHEVRVLASSVVLVLVALVVTACEPPPPPPPPSPHPSGLPWASGVHSANDVAENHRFGTWRGRPLDAGHTFTTRDFGWGPIVRPTDFLEGQNNWRSFDGLLVISQPMYPKNVGANNAACARGEYNQHWRDFGSYLQSIGRADSRTIIRIGWEFNGTFMYWHTDADPTNFKNCWRHVAQSINATAPEVLTDWTLNAHGGPVPASGNMYDAYPGNDVVDIVGMDSYDMYSAPRGASSLTDEEFRIQCEAPRGAGLCDLARFARANGKKLSVGEWGVLGSCGDATRKGHAEADNPVYIRNMAHFFFQNRDILAYEAYYDDPVPGNVCSSLYRANSDGSSNPRASAEYLKCFGPNSPYVSPNPPTTPCGPPGSGPPTTPPPTTPPPPPPGGVTVPFRMNVGGGAYTDATGAQWVADTYAIGGQVNNQGAGHPIAGTTEDALYQDERWGMSGYKIPIANGTYTVALHFAEIYAPCTAPGCRVFSVTAEGNPALTNLDIVAQAGGQYVALVKLINVTVSDGNLDLGFSHTVNASQLAALEIVTQ
jgi:Malectin domain